MPVKSRFSRLSRAIALVMLFAIFHYVAGYRLVYSLGILYSKEQAKECMAEKNNTHKLTLTASEYYSLNWSEPNKEFSFNHIMYDVLAIEKSGEFYILNVYSDADETHWVAAFHDFEKEMFHPDQSTKGAKSAEDIASSFQKDYSTETELIVNFAALNSVTLPFVAVQQHSLRITNTIWHPPTC